MEIYVFLWHLDFGHILNILKRIKKFLVLLFIIIFTIAKFIDIKTRTLLKILFKKSSTYFLGEYSFYYFYFY